jgi:hypothetical protein
MNAEITTIRTLADCETVIERGLGTFVEVGVALFEICDRRLYLEKHETFEQYCRKRWGISRSYAYRQIDAAKIAAIVSPIGDIPNEAVARELSKLNDQPTEQRETWAEAIEEHGPTPTAAQIRAVRTRRHAPEGQPALEGEIQRKRAHEVTSRLNRGEWWLSATLRDEAYIPIIIASIDRKTRQDWLRCARLMRTELTRTIAFLERIDTADDDGGVISHGIGSRIHGHP